MSARARVIKDSEGTSVWFWCAGCEMHHRVLVPRWSFNCDVDRPTFWPSILVTGTRRITDDEARRILAGEKLDIPKLVCHSFVTYGRIEYLADSTHDLKGRVVDLDPIGDSMGWEA